MEMTKRMADDVKRALKSATNLNDIVTVELRVLTNKRYSLECSSIIADDHSFNKSKTVLNHTMQNSMCVGLNPEASRDANNEHLDADGKSHFPDLPGEKNDNPIKVYILDNEKAVRSLLPVKHLQRCTLALQKP